MKRWDRNVDVYLEQCKARGLAEGSIARIGQVLADWGQWMKQRRPRVMLERVDADLIVRYIESRSSFRAKSTVYGTISVMRGMGDHLVREGIWTANPLRWMKGPKITPYSRLPKRLDQGQIQALWREAAASRGEYRRHLWLTVLAVLYGTGLRRGELERLDLDCVNQLDGTLRVDGRKTGRERCVPIPDVVLGCLEAYLPQRHNILEKAGRFGERALFVNQQGSRLAGSSIAQGIQRIAERAEVPIHSVHQFRHSCASDLLEAGVHLVDVQRILGHRGIGTTVRYIHLADPQRRAAIASHPINDWLAQGAS